MPQDPDLDSVAEPLREMLREGLGEAGLEAGSERVEALSRLALLVARWAPRINLTGHRSLEAVAKRLILDAVALYASLPAPPVQLVDLGSGAGFPGLPMAVLMPESRIRLVEAKERKHYFQRAAVREIGLANVICERGRIEELVPSAADLVIAQAVGPASQVLEWALPWVVEGGLLVIPGAEQAPDPGLDSRLESPTILRYQVPLGGPKRTLWLARRRAAI